MTPTCFKISLLFTCLVDSICRKKPEKSKEEYLNQLMVYFIKKLMLQRISFKSTGSGDGRRKSILLRDFPQHLFCALFPLATRTTSGWILAFMEQDQIDECVFFAKVTKKSRSGEIASLVPPLAVSYRSKTNVLRIKFQYTVKKDGVEVVWIHTHTTGHSKTPITNKIFGK